MPLYDYKCKCGQVTEVEAHMDEVPVGVLCKCNEWATRVYYATSFSMNKWNPDFKFVDVSEELDCDKDAKAMGFDD